MGIFNQSKSVLRRHHTMEHNKRAVLAYLKYRIEHVFQLRWEMGTAAVPQELQVNTTMHA
jgi:hypothetical protein